MIFFFIAFLVVLMNFFLSSSIAYKISGSSTKKLSSSSAMSKLVNLMARFINTIQLTIFVWYTESNIQSYSSSYFLFFFRVLLLAATLGTIFGTLYIPSLQRILTFVSEKYYLSQSEKKLYTSMVKHFYKLFQRKYIIIPKLENLYRLKNFKDVPFNVLFINLLAVSFLMIANYSCVYAGIKYPDYRMTTFSMAAGFNGVAAIIETMFVDTKLGLLTDEALNKDITQSKFRRILTFFMASRVLGTLLAQIILVPCSDLIGYLIIHMRK